MSAPKLSTSYKIALVACVAGFILGVFAAFSDNKPTIYLHDDRKALDQRLEKNLSNQDRNFRLGLSIQYPYAEDVFTQKLDKIKQDTNFQILPLTLNVKSGDDHQISTMTLNDPRLKMLAAYADKNNITIAINLNLIAKAQRLLPEKFNNKPFDDPRIIAFGKQSLDQILKIITPRHIHSVSLGSDADLYFKANPESSGPYLTFQSAMVNHIKSKDLDLNVALGLRLSAVLENPDLANTFGENTSLLILSYDPLANFVSGDTHDSREDLLTLAAFFPNKKIHIHRAGFPSGTLCGASEKIQAAFYISLFEAWYMLSPQLESIIINRELDYTQQSAMDIAAHQNIEDMGYICFLESMGLKTTRGEPKQAWGVIKKYMKDLKGPEKQ